MDKGYKFNLGDVLRDKVTKFEGVCVSRANHISGCDTYGLQPETLKDGVPQAPSWFDEPRLEGTGKSIKAVDTRAARTGADSIPQSTR